VYQSLYCYDGPLLCGFNVAIKGLISRPGSSRRHIVFGRLCLSLLRRLFVTMFGFVITENSYAIDVIEVIYYIHGPVEY